jgi:hypothetical protein
MRTREIGSAGISPPLTSTWRLRLAAVAFALGVAAAGAVTVSAAPAQAVPGVDAVSAGSANDTTPLKTIPVDCPTGTRVYGAGGSIQGGFGDVVITGIIPNASLTRVSVTAIQRVAVTTAWRVIARAVCGPASAGLTRVVASATGSPPAAVTPTCPAGTNLFGLGMVINDSVSDSTSAATLTRIVPTSTTQAVMAAAETRAFAASWTLVGYGICANPVATRTIISGTSASTSDTLQQASASCAIGTAVHGLGMEVLPGAGVQPGDLILNSLATVGGSEGASTVTIYERGTGITGVHRVRSFGVCAS